MKSLLRIIVFVSLGLSTAMLSAQDPSASQMRVFTKPAVNGTYGSVDTDGVGPFGNAGVQLLAGSRPDIDAQIGDVSTARFEVFAANQTQSLFTIRRNGNASFGGPGVDYARLEVWAPNASGTSAPGAYKGFMLTNGVDSTLVLRTLGSGHAQITTDAPGRYLTFGTGQFVERMRIDNVGRVMINTTVPKGVLTVSANTLSGATAHFETLSEITSNATWSSIGTESFLYHNVPAGVTNNSGALYGTASRAYLTGAGTANSLTGVRVDAGIDTSSTGVVNNAFGVRINIDKASGTIANGYGLYIEDIEATNGYGVYQAGSNDTNFFGSAVGIGALPGTNALKVAGDGSFTGNLTVTGTITGGSVIGAIYQDVAEWVPATVDMAPGTVVVLNRERSNEVMPSTHAYDTAVAGVVSAQPGVILGRGDASKEQIATTGRVKVHVDATSAPIAIGDLLVSGDRPGTAMKSEPMQINGRTFHQPGTILGKALEPLASGEAEILVLLSLQ